MRRIKHRLDETHVTVDAADVLGWTVARACEHLGLDIVGNSNEHLDLDIVLPVVTEIVGIGKGDPRLALEVP
jgi:hypothetical protein